MADQTGNQSSTSWQQLCYAVLNISAETMLLRFEPCKDLWLCLAVFVSAVHRRQACARRAVPKGVEPKAHHTRVPSLQMPLVHSIAETQHSLAVEAAANVPS